MKNYKFIGLLVLSIGFTSCENNDFDPIIAETGPTVQLNTN